MKAVIYFLIIPIVYQFAFRTSNPDKPTIKISPETVIKIIKNRKAYPNYSLVTAHRGYWNGVPENSTAAFDKAIELGADMIEVDVRLTKDNELVAFHDPCLNRLTTEQGNISDFLWADINKLCLKDVSGNLTKYKILSLAEAVDYIGSRAVITLDVKVKDLEYDEVFIKAVEIFRQRDLLKYMVIKGGISPSKLNSLLEASNTNLSELIYTPVIYNNPNQLSNFNTFLNNEQIYAMELIYKRDSDPILKDDYVKKTIAAEKWVGTYSFWPEVCGGIIFQDQKSCELDIWKYNFINGITPENESYEDPNMPSLGFDKYFFDDGRGDWDWLISNGADYIITDRPALMMAYLKAIGKRSL